MTAMTAGRNGLKDPERRAALARWLNVELLPDWSAVELVAVSRTSGGVSYETWVLQVADPAAPKAHEARFVVRREPTRGPVEPYDVMNEAATLDGLAATDVPVPRVLARCSDTSILERPFTVLEYISGDVPDYRTIMTRADWQDPVQRRAMTSEFMRVLAALQRVDWSRMPHLAEPASSFRSERERLEQQIDQMQASAKQRMATWVPHPIFSDAALWCRRHAPDGPREEMVVIHGDYKVGNFIWSGGRIAAMLDWEGAMVGDPLQDLGYACHPAMREPKPELMAMLAPQDELIDLYERHTGRQVSHRRLHYYVIYALLFHTWTLTVGIPSIVEWDGDMRMATGYAKLNQVTRMLATEIEAYEEDRHVL